ncbi:MAG TPA: peptidylprolyl isomerase [Bacteroidia bacterium]|nr:peptidylprolyl isomerase [Bacteroidia bacterium]
MKKLYVLAFALAFIGSACKQGGNKSADNSNAQNTGTSTQQPAQATARGNDTVYTARISTSMGDIVVKLYNETPIHRDNFIKLANSGFYTDLLFHRVIKGFMIQGGDPDSKNAAPGQQLGAGDVGYTLQAEIDPKFIHKRGALAAARQGDQINPQRRSSGCQFYIVHGSPQDVQMLRQMAAQKGMSYSNEQLAEYAAKGGTPQLDMDYTVFGEVVNGMEVVDKIATTATAPGDRPLQDIKFSIKMETQVPASQGMDTVNQDHTKTDQGTVKEEPAKKGSR